MSAKHKNPYRAGQYHDTFAFIMKKQYVTRADVLKHTAETFGKAKPADVTVLLSPRKDSKRGCCLGNLSAKGLDYYMERCARQIRAGVKEPQKLRLRWRTDAEKSALVAKYGEHKRNPKIEIKAQKSKAVVAVPVAATDTVKA